MKHLLRFVFWAFCFAGISACGLGWFHTNDKFPGVDIFFTMPFQTLRTAIPPDVDTLPETLPDLNAGEMVFFYLNREGREKMAFPDEAFVMHLFQPGQAYRVNCSQYREQLCTEISDRPVKKAAQSGNYPVFKSSVPVRLAARQGGMDSGEIAQALERDAGAGVMTTRKAEKTEVMVRDAASVHTKAAGRSERRIAEAVNVKAGQSSHNTRAVAGGGDMAIERFDLAGAEKKVLAGGSRFSEEEKHLKNKGRKGADTTRIQDFGIAAIAVSESNQTAVSGGARLPLDKKVDSELGSGDQADAVLPPDKKAGAELQDPFSVDASSIPLGIKADSVLLPGTQAEAVLPRDEKAGAVMPVSIAEDTRHLDNATKDYAGLYSSTEDASEVGRLLNTGMLNPVFESSLHKSLLETLLVDAQYDISHLSGIFDSELNQIICDEMYIPAMEERAAFQALLDGDIVIAELLSREFSESFRVNAPQADAGCRYEMTSEFNAIPDILHHGHLAALSISLTNTGNAPIYDLVIVTAVPEHATFAEFGEQHPETHGFLNFYLADPGLMITKVYRPLAPFERFQNVIVFTVDSWAIPGGKGRRVASSS